MTIDLDAANRHAARKRRQRERTARKVDQMHERAQRRRVIPWWRRWLPRLDWGGVRI